MSLYHSQDAWIFRGLTKTRLALKNSDKTHRGEAFQNIVKVKEGLQNYWDSLPDETYCRDLTSGGPLFRSNTHLALSYHLVHISLGRSFILDESNIKPRDAEWLALRRELVDDCVASAVAVIDLCQTLQDKGSLSKSSYTEFSSCCAAVLALVARAVSDKSSQLQDASRKGMELLRNMSTGVFSTSCEKRAVEGLEAAFDRLNHKEDDECDEAGYMQFRNWVILQQQILPGETLQLPRQDNPMMNLLGGSSAGGQYSAKTNGCVLSGYAELSSLPVLGEWFDHGLGQGV